MDDLVGKVAVVTGAASGIGLALAERFVAEGMHVVLSDVDEPRLTEVTARFAEDGGDVAARICDTASEADVAALAEFTIERFGAAHVLCNNAGIGGMGDAWIDPMALWERVVAINLYGVVHGIRSFLPIMNDQGEGHIVNTASMAGLGPMPGAAPYNATKHAVVAISEGLYLELKATGSPVEISVLCPSWVKNAAHGARAGAHRDPDGEHHERDRPDLARHRRHRPGRGRRPGGRRDPPRHVLDPHAPRDPAAPGRADADRAADQVNPVLGPP